MEAGVKNPSAAPPLVSAVIPTCNAGDLLCRSVSSMLRSTYPNVEAIVVDDLSSDGSVEELERRFESDPRLRVIRNPSRLGPAAARNAGVLASRGEYVAFFETDMEATPGWLEPLVETMEADPSLGAVQSLVLDLFRRDVVQAAGIRIVPHVAWVVSIGFGSAPDSLCAGGRWEASIGAVGSLIRRPVFLEAGGFDEALVHNVDDIDLGWRLWLLGHRIVVVPESVSYHWTAKPAAVRGKVTSAAGSEFHTHKVFRILLKNYGPASLARYLPSALMVLGVRAIVNLARGNPAPLIGLGRGIAWTVLTLPETLRLRRAIQARRRLSDRELLDRIMVEGPFWRIWREELKPAMEVSRLFVSPR